VGDVRIDWVVTDPESPITETTCAPIVITSDVRDWYWCTATSEGGTGGNYVDIFRDATPPTVTIGAPFDGQVVEPGTALTAYHWCENTGASYYDPFECTASAPSGAALPTSTPGWHSVTVTAVDEAGNRVSKTASYGVWDNTCQAAPAGLRAWLRFENNLLDATSWPLEPDMFATPTYVSGRSGVGVQYPGPIELWYWDWRLDFSSAMSVAFWFKPDFWPETDPRVLISHSEKYRIERLPDGRVSWTILGPGGQAAASGTSTTMIPADEWAHIAFTFDAGTASLYLNGRLAQSVTVPLAQLVAAQWPVVTVAGDDSRLGASGVYDEVQLYERALDATTIGRLFLARAAGVCPPVAVVMDVPAVTVPYGTHVYEARARILDNSARPVAGKIIEITVLMEPNMWSTNTLVTDADGWATWSNAPLRNLAPGTYPTLIQAVFRGDASHMARSKSTALVLLHTTPAVTWNPAPLVYGTPLGAAQLNASSVPGTWVYTPAAGAILPAGSQTLTGSFTPQDPTYASVTRTATVDVGKATPALALTAGTVVYDGQPHAATAVATDHLGQALTPVTLTYDGAPSAPSAPGAYAVVASYAGDANHTSRTVNGTLTIAPAVPVIALVGGTFTYDGQAHAATASVTGVPGDTPGGVVSITYDGSDAPPVDAGTYAVAASMPATGAYAAASATATLTITKAPSSVSIQADAVVYDGQAHGAVVTATGVNGTSLAPVTVTYDGAADVPVQAGSYSVDASFAGDANHVSASATATMTITRAPVVLSWSTPAPIVHGSPLGQAQLNATANVSGTFSYAPGPGMTVAAGTHTLTATFAPADPQNHQGGAVSTTLVVERAAAAVILTGGIFTYDGQPHAATASATGVGGVALTPVSVTYNGTATVPVAAGSYDVVATFAGDANHASASATTTITIGKAVATLSWNTPAAIGYGTSLGAAQLTAAASVPGTFTFAPAAGTVLGAGGHALTATFTPTDAANYSGGSVSTTISVAPAPLTVRTNDATKAYGAPLPGFTAAFSGLVNGDTPASLGGALAFATAATASSPVGTYAVMPAGVASPDYTIGFVAGTLAIVKAPVGMTLVTSPTPSGLDMPITFTATVTAAQSAPTAPTGTVRFFDGATLVGTATLSGGTATLVTGGLTAGTHGVEARYDGDASFETGTRTESHVVNTAAATPAITITSSRQPAGVGQSTTLTATITVATSGTIGFYDGNTLLGTGTIASGRATLATSSLAAGSHAITARFQGTASAPPVISPVFVQSVTSGGWKDRTSTLALVSSANPSALGAAVTFTATASGSSGTPTGRILFMVDGLIVGDPSGVAVSGLGKASVSVATLNGGRHKVTATYLGNSNYRGSNGALTQTVH
jgi:hypothetical protein